MYYCLSFCSLVILLWHSWTHCLSVLTVAIKVLAWAPVISSLDLGGVSFHDHSHCCWKDSVSQELLNWGLWFLAGYWLTITFLLINCMWWKRSDVSYKIRLWKILSSILAHHSIWLALLTWLFWWSITDFASCPMDRPMYQRNVIVNQ